MPFAGYSDFSDCKKKNKDKGNPDAYCGHIMHQVEGKKVIWEEMPVLLKSYQDSAKKWHLLAYLSSTRRDREGDAFHSDVLKGWANQINLTGVNLGQNHSHDWKATMGAWTKGEVVYNTHEKQLRDGREEPIAYLKADAVLEDPTINPDVNLLLHKLSIGERISVSIAANPVGAKWYDTEADGTRVIKSADLLQADIVHQPANADARGVEVVLKHAKETGCDDSCIICSFNSSLSSFNKQIGKEPRSQAMEEYMTDEEKKKKKEEDDKDKAFQDQIDKFIESLKTNAQSMVGVTLDKLVEATLKALNTQGMLPPAIIEAKTAPGAGPAPAGEQGKPAPELHPPIPTVVVEATPGMSGAGPTPAASKGTPAAPNIDNPAPIPAANINAAANAVITKQEKPKVYKSLFMVEKARETVEPKNESPGEIVPLIKDKPENEQDKEYNKSVIKSWLAQVKNQYTNEQLVKMAQEGQLLSELDPNRRLEKAIVAGTIEKRKVYGTILK